MQPDSNKLLGEYLREVSSLQRWQVIEGLREQVIARDRGVARLLGEILIEQGFVDLDDLELALDLQRRQLSSN